MSTVTTKDGVQIFYKDWGHGQPIVFHHGWPLSSDDWDTQMLFFVHHGYRVIGIDRRGHGRSSQVSDGHDMDHYAADAAAVTEHLDLRNAVHFGHSTGGGEVARYVARHGQGPVAKAVMWMRTGGGQGIMGRAWRFRFSMAFGKAWPPIALNFIAISHPQCSTGLTDQAPSRWMVLLGIGGARA